MQNAKFTGVQFSFVSAVEDPDEPLGEVVARRGEMALDVEARAYPTPYTIVGKWRAGYYAGKDHSRSVVAKWIYLDGRFIGFWVEEGVEYLFTFRLPEDVTSIVVQPAAEIRTPAASRKLKAGHGSI